MTVPYVTLVQLAGAVHKPLLILGPSLGTAVTPLWSEAATILGDEFHVVGWELPGHGSGALVKEPFTVAEIAQGLLGSVNQLLVARGETEERFVYAGESLGGAVGQQLALDAPDRLRAVVTLGSQAKFGEPASWLDRAALVRAGGTAAVVLGSRDRWFTPGFIADNLELVGTLLQSLRLTDDECYAYACEALAAFDLTGRLGEITVPLLAVAGSEDQAAPPSAVEALADGVQDGEFLEILGVAHQIPAEAPTQVADAIVEFVASVPER